MSEPELTSNGDDGRESSVETRHVIVARFMFDSHAEATHAANVLDGLVVPGLLASELIVEEV